MVMDFDTIPSERIRELVLWCAHTKRIPLRQISREDAKAFYQDKQHRMTPWGIQYLIVQGNKSNMWTPPMPGYHNLSDCRKICGSWIRDAAFVENGRTWKFHSVEQSKLLLAFRRDEKTDAALDMADPSNMEVQTPLTAVCKITELPTEVMQQILAHLIPSGCTFQFFPARVVGSTSRVRCVQRFVLEQNSAKSGCDLDWDGCPCRTKMEPSTGSIHLAIATTCRHLQNEAYSIFYSQNTFIFHLTTCAIRNELRTDHFKKFRAWSRRLPQHNQIQSKDEATGFDPLTPLAVAYLRKVMLIPSLPPAPTSKDLAELATIVGRVSASLRHASLKSLTIDLQQPSKSTSTDKRFVLTVLTIDTLQVEVSKEIGLDVALRDPKVILARESNRTQQVLMPLLDVGHSFSKVNELILSGSLSESVKSGLEEAFNGSRTRIFKEDGQTLQVLAETNVKIGARKRKRL